MSPPSNSNKHKSLPPASTTMVDHRFSADSGHSSTSASGHGAGAGGSRRSSHGSSPPTKPSRTTSERGGSRCRNSDAADAAAPARPSSSTEFARQTRRDLHREIKLAQAKLKLVEELDDMKTSEKLDRLFRLIDGDGSGTVDARELAAILRLRNANLTEREALDRAVTMVKAFDADGNAELDQDEFRTFIGTMLEQLRLDPDEFVEFLIFHIAYPEAEGAGTAQQQQQPNPTQPAGSPRRSAATKTVPTRPRLSPRASVSSSCSGSTATTAATETTTTTASSSSASQSPSSANEVGEASARPGHNHHHHQQQRTVASVPKRVRNVGSGGGVGVSGGGDIIARRRTSTSPRGAAAVVPPLSEA